MHSPIYPIKRVFRLHSVEICRLRVLKGQKHVFLKQAKSGRQIFFLKNANRITITSSKGPLVTWRAFKTIKTFAFLQPLNNFDAWCLLTYLERLKCLQHFKLDFHVMQRLSRENCLKLSKLFKGKGSKLRRMTNLELPRQVPTFLLQVPTFKRLEVLRLDIILDEEKEASIEIFKKFCSIQSSLKSLESFNLGLALISANANRFFLMLLPCLASLENLKVLNVTQFWSANMNQNEIFLQSETSSSNLFFSQENKLQEFTFGIAYPSILPYLHIEKLQQLQSLSFRQGLARRNMDRDLLLFLKKLHFCFKLTNIALILDGMSGLTDQSIMQFSQELYQLKRIRELTLVLGQVNHARNGLPQKSEPSQYTSVSVQHLVSFLSVESNELRVLSLGLHIKDFSDSIFEFLLGAVSTLSHLETIELTLFEADITDDIINPLKRCLSFLSNLRVLNLLFKSCKNLSEKFVLGMCNLLTEKKTGSKYKVVKMSFEGSSITRNFIQQQMPSLRRSLLLPCSFTIFLDDHQYSV